MNLLYTLKWDPGDGGNAPRRFFEALRTAVIGKGLPPIANLYEVALVVPADALVVPTDTPDALPYLAILVVNVPPEGETPDAALPALEAWLAKGLEPAPVGLIPPQERTVRPANTLKVASELGGGTRILANFGSFAGNFDVLAEAKEAEEKDAYAAKVAEAHTAMDAADAAAAEFSPAVLSPADAAEYSRAAELERIEKVFKTDSLIEGIQAAVPPMKLSPAEKRQATTLALIFIVGATLAFLGLWWVLITLVSHLIEGLSFGQALLNTLFCQMPVFLIGVVLLVTGILLNRNATRQTKAQSPLGKP